MMDYQEVLANARKTILNCKACPECNGLACGNTLPGPGSKAPGNGAHDNWKAWKSIKLNFDTFVPDCPVDTHSTLFGRECTLPILTGPIGSMLQYSREDVTVAFNDAMIQAASETGIIDCFGDGVAPETLPGALKSISRYPACAIPVLNPMPNERIKERITFFEDSASLAVSVVVDSAGLSHWKHKGDQPGSKTVEDLRELKSCTSKPFIIKGIIQSRRKSAGSVAGNGGGSP